MLLPQCLLQDFISGDRAVPALLDPSGDRAVPALLYVLSDSCWWLVTHWYVCSAGAARSGRGDTEVVVGPRVAQPGWIDGSLRSEPPPMHAMCLRRL